MAEYINREDMNNTLDEMCVVDGIYNALQAIPAADVVEVVRCKDCVHYEADKIARNVLGMCNYLECPMEEFCFCSYGERSESA